MFTRFGVPAVQVGEAFELPKEELEAKEPIQIPTEKDKEEGYSI